MALIAFDVRIAESDVRQGSSKTLDAAGLLEAECEDPDIEKKIVIEGGPQQSFVATE